ncbi:hypothetical protein LRD18_04980 [Halorhodospira halochloris]|uniref:hypothetical protein n=1 Tax=Halorhodospira halochloris TaxID=1052 RepID=UPI001EE7CF99|nr:hypothetical protein [Halorhodospira halochloris]MCG5530228.1 hypothetical protein [Halorhodospira halochloris]
MSEAIKARLNAGRTRRKEEVHYRLLLAACFCVFLLGALLARLVPSSWRASAEGEQRSMIEEARAAARASVPYVFMS